MVFTYEHVPFGEMVLEFIRTMIDALYSIPFTHEDAVLWFVCTLVLFVTLRAAKRNDQLKNKFK